MKPKNRPKITKSDVKSSLARLNIDVKKSGVILYFIRGYFLDSMGDKGRNDRRMYDDAVCVVGADGTYRTFNANTDPSIFRPATSEMKGVASMLPGVYKYKSGIHGMSKPVERRYPALVQASKVTVTRDGGKNESGFFGINVHRGGENTTSSLGCLTIPPSQWNEFLSLVEHLMRLIKVNEVTLVLEDETVRRSAENAKPNTTKKVADPLKERK